MVGSIMRISDIMPALMGGSIRRTHTWRVLDLETRVVGIDILTLAAILLIGLIRAEKMTAIQETHFPVL